MELMSVVDKVKPHDHIDLIAAVNIVGSTLYPDKWAQNPALDFLPFIRHRDKKTNKIVYSRYGYDCDDGKRRTAPIKFPKHIKPALRELARMQKKARKEVIRLVGRKFQGLISFDSGTAELLGEKTSFLTRNYRRVFCSSLVRRKTDNDYDFGFVTFNKELLLKALGATDDNNHMGQRDGSERNKKLSQTFGFAMEELIIKKFGTFSDAWPLFTKVEARKVIESILTDGLMADGSVNANVKSEAGTYKVPDSRKLRKYAAIALPAKSLKGTRSGARNKKRREAAAVVLMHLGLKNSIESSAGRIA